MRKVQEYVLKDKRIFVGLEDSKRTWKLCIRSGGVIVQETRMEAQYSVLQSFFRNRFPDCKIQVMYEAGFSGFGLHDELQADGWDCIVTPPHTVTQEKCQKKKNDKIDAPRLSKNLESGDFKRCYVPEKKACEDRQISRTYGQIQKDITRVSNRLRRTLEFHGLDRQFPPGKWNDKMYKELRQRLEHLSLSDSLRFSLGIMFKERDQLKSLKAELLLQLHKLSKNGPYKETVDILKSAPGIGYLTAVRLALEWGNLTRFKRKEDFSSFLGLIPSDYSSGESERKGHITKQGNRSVRAWLIESSWTAIKRDPALLDKFNRVAGHCGSRKKAIVAVARKLALRLRTLILTGQPYILGVIE